MSPVRVLFFGTPEFAATCLRSLAADPRYHVAAVVTQPDREAGRGKKLTPSPVKTLALEHRIPVVQPQRVKRELDSLLRSLEPHGPFDIGVVVAFGQILPQALLDFPKAGCVNVHGSLLPRWRGAAPIQRAIMAGDRETGIDLMKMEAGLDTGPVYREERLPIEGHDTAGSLAEKLAALGGKMLCAHLASIADGSIIPLPQPEDGVTYAEKISNDEAMIDWSKPAAEIGRTVRGLSPSPGAFSSIRGQRLKIFYAEALPAADSGLPGRVVKASKTTLEVQCGDGVLSLLEVQLQGKKRMPVEEFLKSGFIGLHDQFTNC